MLLGGRSNVIQADSGFQNNGGALGGGVENALSGWCEATLATLTDIESQFGGSSRSGGTSLVCMTNNAIVAGKQNKCALGKSAICFGQQNSATGPGSDEYFPGGSGTQVNPQTPPSGFADPFNNKLWGQKLKSYDVGGKASVDGFSAVVTGYLNTLDTSSYSPTTLYHLSPQSSFFGAQPIQQQYNNRHSQLLHRGSGGPELSGSWEQRERHVGWAVQYCKRFCLFHGCRATE